MDDDERWVSGCLVSLSPCNFCGVVNYTSLSETDIAVLAHLHNVDTREQLV